MKPKSSQIPDLKTFHRAATITKDLYKTPNRLMGQNQNPRNKLMTLELIYLLRRVRNTKKMSLQQTALEKLDVLPAKT